MAVVKFLLVFMGVFILVGFAYVGMEVYYRLTVPGYRDPAPQAALTNPLTLGLEGRIRTVQTVGNRLYFVVETKAGDRLYSLDPARGTVTTLVDAIAPAQP